MCGIAGVITWSPDHRITRDMLSRMSQCIAHRGPDGEGWWINHEDDVSPAKPQVGLVHRRLAILDPDPRSNQPFTDGLGRWIVFNGEIYNFRELRKQLETLLPDHPWKTSGDTEVLLAAYAAWGEKCVDHLNGMYAFVVWDENTRGVYLARDRMGQKPLYILATANPLSIAFASELSALRTLPWARPAVDRNSLIEYLQWGYVPGTQTFYDDCRKLRPGSYATADGASPTIYWSPSPKSDTTVDAGVIRTATLKAVERQLVSDVPLGCFLSGGVDSSCIAAAMVKAVGDASKVHTFSVGFDDPRYDESRFAQAMAEHLGTSHHPFRIQPDAAADLPKLAAVFGEPFADSSALPTHYLSRETREHVKVALSGDGGDELFGGYERYRAVAMAAKLDRLPGFVRTLLTKRANGKVEFHPKSFSAKVHRFRKSLALPAGERYASYMHLFDDHAIARLIPDLEADDFAEYVTQAWQELSNYDDPVRRALAVDRETYLPDDLLTKVDRASMLHALEVRSPFMDHELVSLAATLTTDQLLGGGPKRMLREAFRDDVPGWVFTRQKMGFAVPIGDWFRGELKPMLHDHLFADDSFASDSFDMRAVRELVDEHAAGTVDHSQRLYALLMLELWWRGQDAASPG
jgi:asparagine synthase (glutamine-hydrolysing)